MAAISNGAKLRSAATWGVKWAIVFSNLKNRDCRLKKHRFDRAGLYPLIRIKGVMRVSAAMALRRLDVDRRQGQNNSLILVFVLCF